MIIVLKPSKIKKIKCKEIFQFVSVSNDVIESEDSSIHIFNMTELLPPADLFMKYNNGSLSKKKFNKKYKSFISEKNTNVEYSIFSLGMALKAKKPIVITANEKEFRMGYVKVLADYIGELFGVDVGDLDSVNETISMELDNYTKKERKLLTAGVEDLSKKKEKLRSKILKTVSKSVVSEMSDTENYDDIDKRFAIDQIAMVLFKAEAVKVDKKTNGFKDINADMIPKVKPYITALFIAAEESKPIKKIIKSVFDSHQLKFKEKTCKKMDIVTFITLFGEIYGKILAYRCGELE